MTAAAMKGCVLFVLLLCGTPAILSKQPDHAEDTDENGGSKSDLEQCKDMQMEGMMSIMRSYEVCKRDKFYIENYQSDETRPTARRCFAKCVLRQEKVLDVSGALTFESFHNALKGRVSGNLHGIVMKVFLNCYEQYGALLKPDDPTCLGYDEIGHCLKPALQNVCDGLEFVSSKPAIDAKEEL